MNRKTWFVYPLMVLALASCQNDGTKKQTVTIDPNATSSETSGTNTKDSSDGSIDSTSGDASKDTDDSEETTVVLDASNGAITDEAYTSSTKSAKDSKGNTFSFDYENAIEPQNKTNYFAQLKKNEGLIKNSSAISGLRSINVVYQCSGSKLPKYSFSSTGSADTYETLVSGTTYEASDETFFFIKAGGNAVYIKSITITFGGKTKTIEWDTNYSPTNVTKDYTANENIKLTQLDYCTPSTGSPNVLVLPIEFSDDEFTESEIQDIKTITGGSAEDTNYWESLASYYKKSSYGKLDLQFTYADPYNLGVTAKSFYNSSTSTDEKTDYAYGSAYAMRKAVEAYKDKNGDNSTQKFDSDNDGYIDSVIMIYSADSVPDYDENGSLYWAYRYYDVWDDNMAEGGSYPAENVNSPVGYSYFWASIDFSYDGVSEGTGVDAHTLIHEFGHLLGSDDYYNSDGNSSSKAVNEPTGGKIMMAYNILDHDAFNKLQYDWVTPNYVTGSCDVTISSFEKTGDCILVADDNGWNKTAFDEYILIELYTPTGLNELDSKTNYCGKGRGQTTSGVRMWHVDNRLYKYDAYSDIGWASDSEVKNGDFGDDYASSALSNSSENYYSAVKNKNYNALSLISPKGTKFTSDNLSTEEDLFKQGDKFSLIDSSLKSTYTSYFGGQAKFDNGNDFNYTIEVTSLSSDSATLRFTKKI